MNAKTARRHRHERAAKAVGRVPIPPSLKIFTVPIEDLAPDPDNARRHPDHNLAAIQRSLAEFGQQKPLVVRNGVIIAGNGTYEAAIRLGWTTIQVVRADHLTDAQARAFAIADNKTGESSEWDMRVLAAHLRLLPPELHSATGFSKIELDPMLAEDYEPPGKNPGVQAHGVVTFHATIEQAAVIRQAILALKAREADSGPDMSEGRALELICADFISGAPIEA